MNEHILQLHVWNKTVCITNPFINSIISIVFNKNIRCILIRYNLENNDKSFTIGCIDTTASKQKKQTHRPPKEWLVPANPKYYDIEHAFDSTEEIDWKQGNGIRVGDTIFMYVAAPVSAILFQCAVTETGIPYEYSSDALTITSLMKIKQTRRYQPDQFSFDRLKEEYGIFAVRGPRGVPHSLSEELKK